MTYKTFTTKAEANTWAANERAAGRRANVVTYNSTRHEVRSWRAA